MFDNEELVRLHKTRAQAISNIILACFSLVLARLWYLQVYRGQLLNDYSVRNRLRQEIVYAPRGMIFDINDRLLVDNIPRFDAAITPQYLQNKAETLTRLAKILSMTEESLLKILQKNQGMPKYRPILVKKNISRKEVAIIETENADLPGVGVEIFIGREYLDKEVGSHLLGYISEVGQEQLPKLQGINNKIVMGDFIGQFGLEEQWDQYLRGEDGHEFVEVDALGRKKRQIEVDNLFRGIKNKEVTPGHNIRLTIDSDLQKVAYDAMQGRAGAVVMMEVNTGRILTQISTPGFDPSAFGRGITPEYWNELTSNDHRPMRDRTIQEHYSPGSVFKAIIALAALEEGIVDEHTEVSCNGKFKLGRRVFHCWRKFGHGKVNFHRSMKESCDVYYYRLATKLDIDVLAKYARALGSGEITGIQLPREIPGLVPTKAWKEKRFKEPWQMGDTVACAIGQSYMLSTPLQMAVNYAAIANGGKIYRPLIVDKIFNNQGELLLQTGPELLKETTFKKKNLDLVRKGLHAVMNSPHGTVFSRRVPGIDMAGKTGTSQVIRFSADKIFTKCIEHEYKYRHHGIFVGYAPFDDPSIVVSVVVEHGCSGSAAASPIAQQVALAYMKKYRPDVYEKNLKKKIPVLAPVVVPAADPPPTSESETKKIKSNDETIF